MRTDLMGIIFSNAADEMLRELTAIRCLGSVPFGGRYRLIDFALSNFVNAGVSKVAVLTKSNYRSLIDHLGSGKPWDLARKKGGISIFPPFINYGEGARSSRIEQLVSVMPFLSMSAQEYVVLCDCDVVSNIDIEEMVRSHIDSGSDITIAYKNGALPRSLGGRMVFSLEKKQRITEITCPSETETACDFSLNIAVLRRELLVRIINDAQSRSFSKISRDILLPNINRMTVTGYRIENYSAVICGMQSYLDANMDLLSSQVRQQLFNTGRTIYTKVRDEMPVRYGLGADVKNSLLADGCMIEGKVENCILFRNVKIEKDAEVRNSIIMQSGKIGSNCRLDYTITDKDVSIGDHLTLTGHKTYPVFISKGTKL